MLNFVLMRSAFAAVFTRTMQVYTLTRPFLVCGLAGGLDHSYCCMGFNLRNTWGEPKTRNPESGISSRCFHYILIRREGGGGGGGGRGEGSSREVWVEMYRRGLQTQTLFKTKIAHFATLFKTQNTTF